MGEYRRLSTDDLRAVLSAYGLSGYRAHTPIAAGTINTNVRVEADGGPWFLRVNEGKPRAEVEREAAIVEHVAARGLATPVPLRARDGACFVPLGDALVSLFPWVHGRTLRRDEVGPAQARAAGAALARLHLAGRDFDDRRPGRYEPDEIARRLAAVAALDRPELAEAVMALRPELDRLARVRADGLPLGLIHGDLFIDNVLFDEAGELVALLDFEQASWGRLAYDLAVTLLAFAFGRDDFRPAETRALIEGYSAVRPVTPAERAAFADELAFAACRFAVTRITDVHLRRAAGAPGGKDFRRYLLRLRRVHAHAGDGLLAL